ncbi:MAG TPA: FHA domain-containing serine/threonine-protein kinase [Ktedonobacteraceae bacterium]|jgi:serine/threonine-protein kinase|nr:FHA domain-containing serine/threonine-protein kinase [Ktedonobacteraceae bacterium]
MNDPMIGRIINNRYKLLDERGSGSFGAVYIARDLQTNYLYAAKTLHIGFSEDNELLERFKREAYILERLKDPHIVRIVDYGNDKDIYFIIMNHIDGQNLKYYMVNQGPMDLQRALNYVQQAAEGLETAHKHGVIHRDLKPQNILVNNKGVVKLVDFGLSRGRDMPTITHSDKFMGTVYYCAPEQIVSSHTADIRSDLYSLAVVLFELLTGRPPFDGRTAVEVIIKHQQEEVPSIQRFYPDKPLLDAFFQKAMAKDPRQRFQTPREFIAAIQRIQQGTTAPLPQPRLVFTANNRVVLLNGTEMLVGREDPKREIHPDIQVEDQTMTVGRQHARLINSQGTWMIEDRNSRNKTRLNGEILPPYEARPLKDGDIISFGRIEARFELR